MAELACALDAIGRVVMMIRERLRSLLATARMAHLSNRKVRKALYSLLMIISLEGTIGFVLFCAALWHFVFLLHMHFKLSCQCPLCYHTACNWFTLYTLSVCLQGVLIFLCVLCSERGKEAVDALSVLEGKYVCSSDIMLMHQHVTKLQKIFIAMQVSRMKQSAIMDLKINEMYVTVGHFASYILLIPFHNSTLS